MAQTAIGIIGGAIVAIIITIVVEIIRRPKIQMRIGSNESISYPHHPLAHTGHYLHIEVLNKPLPRFLRWLARDVALQCRGTLTFHTLDGAQFFKTPMLARFARSPEPIPLEIRFADGVGVLIDPLRMSLESRFDLYPGEATPIDVAVKFDSEDDAYGWTNENYFSEPMWRNSDWRLPRGCYLVAVTVTASNARCKGLFRLLNNAGPSDFRLTNAQSRDKVTCQ